MTLPRRPRGRPPGGRGNRAKLSDAEVLQIRQARAGGATTLALAAEFGVHFGTIIRVSAGETYTYLEGPLTPTARKGRRATGQPAVKLDEDRVRQIRRAATEGLSQQQIARDHGVSQGTVSMVLRRLTWAHVGDE